MKKNNTVTIENAKSEASQESTSAVMTAPVTTSDTDMAYFHDDIFFYDTKCMSCEHWFGHGCRAPHGACGYKPY